MTRLERVKLIGHNQASIPIGKSRLIIDHKSFEMSFFPQLVSRFVKRLIIVKDNVKKTLVKSST